MPNDLTGSTILLHPTDNVAVAARFLKPDTDIQLNGHSIRVTQAIDQAHKFAIVPIDQGKAVTKYGQTIGFATQRIEPGQHVHLHNVACDEFDRDYQYASAVPDPPVAQKQRFFDGYLRDDGRVGTRNYIVLASTVNCSGTTCQKIVAHFDEQIMSRYPNVDGIFAITHKSGCAMSNFVGQHKKISFLKPPQGPVPTISTSTKPLLHYRQFLFSDKEKLKKNDGSRFYRGLKLNWLSVFSF